MRTITAPLGAILILVCATPAAAQDALVEGPGVKVGEGTVLHPHAGAEAGFVNNVFFEEADTVQTGIFRVLAGIYASNIAKGRPDDSSPGSRTIEFQTGVDLAYEEYISSKDTVRDQRNLGVDANGKLVLFPQAALSLTLQDTFQRTNRPTNFESSEILARDINQFRAELTYHPGGRTISTGVRYENRIDLFESDQSSFANRIQHLLGLRANWQWLPHTNFFFDSSYGIFGGLGDNELAGMTYKNRSNPLRIIAGIATAITPVTTARLFGGYAKGFYDAGPDFGGFTGGAQFGWRYLPTGRMVLAYTREFRDSINANFYSEHGFRIGADQDIDPIVLKAGLSARLRSYQGVPMQISPMGAVRDDFFFVANLRASYIYGEMTSFYLDYSLRSVETDFRVGMDDPSYLRQQILGGASFYY